MLSFAFPILIAAVFAGVVMVAEHYWPWQYVSSAGKLHPVANYVLGILGILGPFTMLTFYWQFMAVMVAPWIVAIALWVIVVSAGFAVALCYGIDLVYHWRTRAREAEAREKQLADQLQDAL